SLHRLGDARGADFVATAHYARIVQNGHQYSLRQPHDLRKDQSYFLYRIGPSWLPRILFPVGSMQKSTVWARAESLGLPADELKERQEICFVSQGSYRTLSEREGREARPPRPFRATQ